MPRLLPRLLPLLACLAASPARAQDTANRSPATQGPPGPVAAYVAAARLLPLGFAAEDPLAVLTAVRLARSVSLRPATAWQATPEPDPLPAPAAGLPRDPGDEDAALLLAMMTEGDDDLQLAAQELLAVPASGAARSAVAQGAGIAGGGATTWTIPFYGQAPAEIGLVALADAALTLRVTDAQGAEICGPAPVAPAALCAFTPVRNGWFRVEIANGTGALAGYLLLTN